MVDNRTLVSSGLDRAGALRSRCSRRTRSCACRAGGSSRRSSVRAGASTRSRCSPRRPTTWSLGAAIVLPDHPEIAPESRGACSTPPRSRRRCCCTCTRCSDAEREEIERQDPGRAGDARARRRRDARGHRRAARPRDRSATRRRPSPRSSLPGLLRSTRRRGDRRRRRRHVSARGSGRDRGRARRRPARADARRPHARRSSGSSSTTTAACTSA